jgi:hypothetical protein
MHRRGGDASIPLPPPSFPVGEAGFPPYMDASAANCPACPNVPGSVMTGICNCNSNFDMNMFLRNVENSVSKILTEKEMIYHQRLEKMENRLSNLATSGPISSASDHFLSVRSRVSVTSYQTEAEMTSCLDVLSKESGADEASKTSGSGFEHIKAYVSNEYAVEWSCNLEKVDNLSEVYSSIAMTSSEAQFGGVKLMMERVLLMVKRNALLLCLVTIVFWRKSKED